MGKFTARAAKGSSLEKAGFGKVVVRKPNKVETVEAVGDEDAGATGRAVKVMLFDTEKTLASEPILYSGQDPYDAGGGIEVTYR